MNLAVLVILDIYDLDWIVWNLGKLFEHDSKITRPTLMMVVSVVRPLINDDDELPQFSSIQKFETKMAAGQKTQVASIMEVQEWLIMSKNLLWHLITKNRNKTKKSEWPFEVVVKRTIAKISFSCQEAMV